MALARGWWHWLGVSDTGAGVITFYGVSYTGTESVTLQGVGDNFPGVPTLSVVLPCTAASRRQRAPFGAGVGIR